MTMCSHCRQPVARIWGRLMCVNRNCPGEMLTALLAERDALKQTLHDELDANLRLRDLGGAKPDEPMTPFIERVIAERDALAAKLAQARGALAVCERAADMLTAYAELIRRDGASRIDQHHYLPEVEHVAQTLREASPPPALFVPDDAALAQEPAHTDHPARHFDWQPHRWVVDAMLLAAHEAEEDRDRFRHGNTAMLGLLMKLHAGDDISAVVEDSRAVLRTAGLLRDDNTLDWAALEARKPQQKTWAEAVNECVTDPEARARLLAMDCSSSRQAPNAKLTGGGATTPDAKRGY